MNISRIFAAFFRRNARRREVFFQYIFRSLISANDKFYRSFNCLVKSGMVIRQQMRIIKINVTLIHKSVLNYVAVRHAGYVVVLMLG